MKIFLVGYRGTGKSTAGLLLSGMLGFSFIDTDREIEREYQRSIRDMVDTKGWEYFRQVEKSMLFDLEKTDNAVIATGGGIVIDSENREFLNANGLTFRLYADPETMLYRIGNDTASDGSRPTLTGEGPESEIKAVSAQREPLYKEVADHQINTSDKTPQQVAKTIKRRIDNGG
ncbi:MAG: shikimate kinase [Desulfobacteraceae bacterium]